MSIINHIPNVLAIKNTIIITVVIAFIVNSIEKNYSKIISMIINSISFILYHFKCY
jgi:hypothetical protein